VSHCHIAQSVVGVRSLVDVGSHVTRSVIMGADSYETPEALARNQAEGTPRIGIGRYTRIDHAIIDKNARIGDHCVITPHGKPETVDHPLYYIRDGIVIIPKGMVIPHGTVI
jgi:glucose-1-phosphate adenylyltransferase